MATADIRGQKLHFDDVGHGPPIVFGHSFLCTGEMWRAQLAALSRTYRTINIDLRGHGESGPADAPFSLYDAVDDVIGVLDAVGIDRAAWCGLSIGGMVALRAAVTYPERVAALVLMDTDAGAERWLRKLRYMLMAGGARLAGIQPFIPAVSRLMFGVTTKRKKPGLVEQWEEIFASIDLPSALRCLDALMDRDSIVPRLGEIEAPWLVLVGEEDRSLPPDRSRRIHRGIRGSTYEMIRGAGHLSALEQPEEVNDAIKAFLELAFQPKPAA